MTTPADVLAKFRGWIDDNGGEPEDPPGSNHNDITEAFADLFGPDWEWMRRAEPWCDASVSVALTESGLWTCHASCLDHIDAYQRGDGGVWLGYTPELVKPGDLVFYGPGGGSHVEIVDVPGAGGAFTYGGNVRDAVRHQWRPYRGSGFDVFGFGQPAYDGTPTIPPPPLPAGAPTSASLAMPEVARGTAETDAVRVVQSLTGADVDGDFGPDTDRRVRNWQRFVAPAAGAVDGAVGDRTWTVFLQYLLRQAGAHDLAVDGEIGPQTTNVLIFWQAVNGLEVDGIAGPETFGRLVA